MNRVSVFDICAQNLTSWQAVLGCILSIEVPRAVFKWLRKEAEPEAMGPLYPQVREAMRDVQAYARSHGGEIQLVSVDDDGNVRIRLRGTCSHCPLSTMTLKHGVEERLLALVPGVRSVLQA